MNHWEEALYKKKGETIESNYLNNSSKMVNTKKMFDYVDSKMVVKGNVLEIGCSLARNLREAQKRYDCKVFGIDINKESIDKNVEHFKDKGVFLKSNLLEPRNLEVLNFPDKHFSLGISMGFLMHIPQSDSKTRLIKEFTRICDHVCIFELFDSNRKQVIEENEFSVSFEDYRRYDMGLKLTDVYGGRSKKENFVLFYK